MITPRDGAVCTTSVGVTRVCSLVHGHRPSSGSWCNSNCDSRITCLTVPSRTRRLRNNANRTTSTATTVNRHNELRANTIPRNEIHGFSGGGGSREVLYKPTSRASYSVVQCRSSHVFEFRPLPLRAGALGQSFPQSSVASPGSCCHANEMPTLHTHLRSPSTRPHATQATQQSPTPHPNHPRGRPRLGGCRLCAHNGARKVPRPRVPVLTTALIRLPERACAGACAAPTDGPPPRPAPLPRSQRATPASLAEIEACAARDHFLAPSTVARSELPREPPPPPPRGCTCGGGVFLPPAAARAFAPQPPKSRGPLPTEPPPAERASASAAATRTALPRPIFWA